MRAGSHCWSREWLGVGAHCGWARMHLVGPQAQGSLNLSNIPVLTSAAPALPPTWRRFGGSEALSDDVVVAPRLDSQRLYGHQERNCIGCVLLGRMPHNDAPSCQPAAAARCFRTSCPATAFTLLSSPLPTGLCMRTKTSGARMPTSTSDHRHGRGRRRRCASEAEQLCRRQRPIATGGTLCLRLACAASACASTTPGSHLVVNAAQASAHAVTACRLQLVCTSFSIILAQEAPLLHKKLLSAKPSVTWQ